MRRETTSCLSLDIHIEDSQISPEIPSMHHPDLAISDVVELRNKGRICVPASILKAGNFIPQHRSQTLIVELLESEHLRFYPQKDVQEQLNTRIKELDARVRAGDDVAAEELSVIVDKYRTVTMESDGRINLPTVVLAHLGCKRNVNVALFIRFHQRNIEVLTLKRREQLLADYRVHLEGT